MLTLDSPEGVGLHPERWNKVLELLRGWCAEGLIPGAGLLVGRGGKTTGTHLFGRHSPYGPEPIHPEAMFLIASITKPIVATGALTLIEDGLMSLGDRVTDYLPEFANSGKHGVTIRNLLTHSSGLPDMLPNNFDLRRAHAQLSKFVAETCGIELAFPPGRGVQYQSMGFAILGEIITRVSGKPCSAFLKERIFAPLGMNDTALGAPEEWFSGTTPKMDRVAEIRIPPEQEGADWNWNGRYWRMLGVPWGGLLTTPHDLSLFAQMMLSRGTLGSTRILSEAAVAAATCNQLADMRDIPADERRCRPWGLGWRLNWPAHSENFGDFLGPCTYGHWGSTGTLLWIDPDREAFLVLLTTQPQEPNGKFLARISNAVMASFV